jgi:hypothetical protein
VADAGVVIETDGGIPRRLPAAYVAEHVEHAYALTGHAMQGGTVEQAFVFAAPHELTKGWSYTALSRARADTRLFVLTDGQDRDRDELAPGERQSALRGKELHARLARSMRTRDDEDLAIEQLPAPSSAMGRVDQDPQDRGVPVHEREETGAGGCEPVGPTPIEAFHAARARLASMRAELESLTSPDVRRLEAAERRAAELAARRDELAQRARQLPSAPRRRLATDRHAVERENLASAIAGVDAELRGVRSLHDRLVAEVGDLGEIRATRSAVEQAIASVVADRDTLSRQLITGELEPTPLWATGAIGEQPTERHDRELWDRAARGLARYRLENDVVDDRSALGERPDHAERAERYDHAHTTLDRIRRQLGHHTPERELAEPVALPSDYTRLFGEDRVSALEQALAAERDAARRFTAEQLRTLATEPGEALTELDRQAASRAVRLEHEQAHHQDIAAKQIGRATELESRADTLGWRDRAERGRLRHDAALHRQHAARHTADAERTELELQRLREAGRHPDQWLVDHGQALAMRLAASAELAHRRELEIRREVNSALTEPPAHVRRLIGDPPTSAVRVAREWERVAEHIERHRLTYDLDLDRDGPLGPEPPAIGRNQRSEYEQQRRELAADIDAYRHEHGLVHHEYAREMTREPADTLGREQ